MGFSLADPGINQPQMLVAGRYDSHLRQLIAQAEPINAKQLIDSGCTDKILPIPRNLTGSVEGGYESESILIY